MKFFRSVAFMLMVAFFSSSKAADSTEVLVTDRAVQFTVNAYTGVKMENAEWMTEDSLIDPDNMILAFGGLASVVSKSTKLAREEGGLRSVEVIRVENIGDVYRVVTRVRFFNERRRASKQVGAIGDWFLFFRKENGVWKIPKTELMKPFLKKNEKLDGP